MQLIPKAKNGGTVFSGNRSDSLFTSVSAVKYGANDTRCISDFGSGAGFRTGSQRK